MAAAKTKPETVEEVTKGEELVDAFYPDVPGTHYSGDIQVGINGAMFLVKRGENVKIPKNVKEVIDYSIAEDQKIAKKLQELEAGN